MNDKTGMCTIADNFVGVQKSAPAYLILSDNGEFVNAHEVADNRKHSRSLSYRNLARVAIAQSMNADKVLMLEKHFQSFDDATEFISWIHALKPSIRWGQLFTINADISLKFHSMRYFEKGTQLGVEETGDNQ